MLTEGNKTFPGLLTVICHLTVSLTRAYKPVGNNLVFSVLSAAVPDAINAEAMQMSVGVIASV